MNLTLKHKWLKIGIAAFLSIALLAGCGDGNETDTNEPVEEDLDVDVNVDDNNDENSENNGSDEDKEDVEDTDDEVMDKDRE